MFRNTLTKQLNIQHPIIQAPMAGGVTTSELVAEVSNAGGLGTIGVGGMPADQLRKQIREVKALTTNHFGVNLFVPNRFHVTDKEISETNKLLDPLFKELEVKHGNNELPTFEGITATFHKYIDIIIEEKVPVCSFIFGIPEEDTITKLKSEEITVIGTATTVREAVEIEKTGFDAVVVQGSEAGGHRGSFLDEEHVGLRPLLTQAVRHVKIPVIAAGGIMDGADVKRALDSGAMSVQMGTAFLTTIESGAHPLHKEAILAQNNETVVTRAFTGRKARAIRNGFIDRLGEHEANFPAFPLQRVLTQPIVKTATERNIPDYMLLLAGKNKASAKNQKAKTLIENLISELEE